MKKIARIILGCILFFNTSYGQVKLELGPIMKNANENIPEKILGQDEKYFYLLKSIKEGKGISFFIEKYAIEDYTLQYSKCINTPNESKTTFLEAYFTYGKILIFREFYEKKEDETHTVFMQIMDDNGKISPDLKEIHKIVVPKMKMGVNLAGSNLGGAYMFTVYYSISISDDKKNILVVSNEYKTTTETIFQKANAKVIDAENLAVKFNKEIPNQYDQSKIEPWNYKVDNIGNILFNFSYHNSDNKAQTAIGLVNQTSSSIIGMDINFDRVKLKIEDIDFKIKENKIFCSILYQNRVKIKEKTDLAPLFGVFSQQFNLLTFKPEKSDSLHFSKEIIEKLSTGRSYYFRDYRIADIEIIGEDMYTIIEQTSLVKGAFTIYKFGKNGTIDWIKAIPRNFDIHSHHNNQFHLYVNNQKLFLIFGEDESISKKQTLDKLTMDNIPRTSNRKASIVIVSIDSNGSLAKDVIYKNDKFIFQFTDLITNINGSYYSPINDNLIVPLKSNSAIVFFKNGNETKFGKIIFK